MKEDSAGANAVCEERKRVNDMQKELWKENIIKCAVAAILMTLIFAVGGTGSVRASSDISGECGENAYWTLDSDGNLYITGSGEIVQDELWKTYEIKSVEIGEGITSIGGWAFYDCSSLTSVTIPEGVTSIGESAFGDCISLTSATIPEGVTSIEEKAFCCCSSLTSVTIPEGITSIEASVFACCNSLTDVIIPEGVTSIGYCAFFHCDGLTSVTIPEGVTSIGESAFYYCDSLTSVTIPEGITNIGDYVFSECNKLTDVTLPGGVTGIGGWAFQGCDELTSVTLPEGVTNIGDYAFSDCNKLTSVNIQGNAPQDVSENSFGDAYSNLTFYVPVDAVGYDAEPWSRYRVVYGTEVIYTLIYDANGGENAPEVQKKTGGIDITLSDAVPTRTGYTFLGWAVDKEAAQADYQAGGLFERDEDITLYAQWVKEKYTITYNLNGGKNNTKNPSSYDVTTAAIILQNPTRTGYAFNGWYMDSAYKTKVTRIAEGSAGEKTLYAKWSPNVYTIRYDKNGGTGSMADSVSMKYGTEYTLRANTFQKKGYTFAGWATTTAGKVAYKDKVKVKNLSSKSGEVKILYAKWIKTKYTITYNLNGGKNSTKNPVSYDVTTDAITLQNPTRTGYTFKGWYADSAYKTKVTKIAKGDTGAKRLYAKWSPNVYTVRYNKNGGTGSMSDSKSLKYGTNYTLRANTFQRKGYTFAGWATTKDGKVIYKNKAKIKNLSSKDGSVKVLYAKWTPVKYTITYNLNGGKNNAKNPASYTVTTATITLKNPTRAGHTFKGWYADSKYKTRVTKITKGSTGVKKLYAKWS